MHSPRIARLLPCRVLGDDAEPFGRPWSVPLDMDIGMSSLHELGTNLLQVRVPPAHA